MKKGLVSVIMPAYNAQDTIKRAIESVLQQTYSNVELLITDDFSTDNTKDIILAAACKDPRVVILENTSNQGVAKTRNHSIRHANGQYIAFLDSDDCWALDKLEKQVALMKEYNVYASHASYYRVTSEYETIGHVYCKKLITLSDMLKINQIGNLTGIYDASKLGKFYQESIGHEDYDMWLRVLMNTNSIGVSDFCAEYTISSGTASSNKLKASVWHYKIINQYLSNKSIFIKLYYFSSYIVLNIKKRTLFHS